MKKSLKKIGVKHPKANYTNYSDELTSNIFHKKPPKII